jgi:GT2 family glycosyltransferase
VVVDDGSTDGSAALAARFGAHVIKAGQARGGPGQARNLGARVATAPLLCFIDADVLVRPDTLAEFVRLFASDPDLSAAFGSYDTQPEAQNTLSQYRNLLHHFVHQTSSEDAGTFWTGCGAIRRDVFLALGGFDPTYTRPSIEDIELGYRIRAAGGRIRLAKHIQVRHLKRWTFCQILATDVRDRALPWTALIARSRRLPNDLNLQTGERVSAFCVYLLAATLALSFSYPWALLAAGAALIVLLRCNEPLYAFFLRQRGPWFLFTVLPMHWLYYAYSALAFGGGMLFAGVSRLGRRGV